MSNSAATLYIGDPNEVVNLHFDSPTAPWTRNGAVIRDVCIFDTLKDSVIEGCTFTRPVVVKGGNTLNGLIYNCRFNAGLTLSAGTSWRLQNNYFNGNSDNGVFGVDARGHDGLIASGNIFDGVSVCYKLDNEAAIGPDWIDVSNVTYHWDLSANNHITVIRGRGFTTASHFTGVTSSTYIHLLGYT